MDKHRVLAAVLSAGCLVLVSCGGDSNSSSGVSLQTLSNRADLISGGTALVQINLPASANASQLRVDIDGTDASSAFSTLADGRTVGLLTGLKNGANVVTAKAADASFGGARLTITNHPIGGPVLLGAQIQPWVCATPTPVGRDRQHARLERQRPDDQRDRRPVQHRDRVQAVLPHDRGRLLDRRCPTRARRPPAPTNNCFKPYTRRPRHRPTWRRRPRRDGVDRALHRPRRARHDQPRHLRHRGAVRPDQAVDADRAAAAVEPQGRLLVRRQHRPAAAAVPHASRTGPTTRRCRAASWSSTTA